MDGAGSTARSIDIRLLGGFDVRAGGVPVPPAAWRTRKDAGLLKLLALAPARRLLREDAVEALWPDARAAAAASNLRYALHTIRRALQTGATSEPPIRLTGDSLVLASAGEVRLDTERFDAAANAALASDRPAAFEAACRLCPGDLLPDDVADVWTAEPRRRYRARYVTLRRRQAALYEEAGEPSAAVAALRDALDREPCAESVAAALIRLLAHHGDHRGAAGIYRRLEDALRRSFGADPSAETRALYRNVPGARVGSAHHAEAAIGVRRHAAGTPLAGLVGREVELERVTTTLGVSRLVTLTGPGGIGKTRLALEVARVTADRYADRISVVELAPLTEPALVPGAVATALGLGGAPGDVVERIRRAVAGRQVLVILDNAEHLIGATAEMTAVILHAGPGTRVLVTSREPLGVAGETIVAVPPLATLGPHSHEPATVAGCPSVRLFVERARAARPDFNVTPASLAMIGDVCRQLDGLPLAIELAAARAKTLTVEQIADRLANRFWLAEASRPVGPTRHRSLHAAIAWSHGLLEADEAALFARLSVFEDGWTVGLAEAVCAEPGESAATLDKLARLVDQSLVFTDFAADQRPRYRLLETLRDFAAERLRERGERRAVRDRHAAAMLALATAAAAAPDAPDEPPRFRRLDAERANIRGALAHLVASGRARQALELCVAMRGHWTVQHQAEGVRWLRAALTLPGDNTPDRLRARALNVLGLLLYELVEYSGSAEAARAALALAEGDTTVLADSNMILAGVAYDAGDGPSASRYAEQAIEHFISAGLSDRLFYARAGLARIYLQCGDPDRAEAVLLRTVGVGAPGSTVDRAHLQIAWGDLLAHRGHLGGAIERFAQAAELYRSVKHTYALARTTLVLGAVARAAGNRADAAGYYRAADAVCGREGIAAGCVLAGANRGFLALAAGENAAEAFRAACGAARDVADNRLRAAALAGAALVVPRDVATPLFAAAARFAEGARPPIPWIDPPDLDAALAELRRRHGEPASCDDPDAALELASASLRAAAVVA